MVIIGITGTLGAGKGTIVDFLIRQYNFTHYSVREYLIEEIISRGLEVNRDSMTMVANELRANNSPSFIVDELYKKAVEDSQNCVIESIRTPGEVESLKSKSNFYLFAVDANPRVRYERIRLRKSSTDNVDYETFIANEAREMSTTDPNKQNIGRCIKMADFKFNNDGDIETLQNEISNILLKINKNG